MERPWRKGAGTRAFVADTVLGSCISQDGRTLSVASGAQGDTVSCSSSIALPPGTERVAVKVSVTTAEFPQYTQSKSVYDDKWSFNIDIAGRVAMQGASSVNQSHSNLGTIVTFDRCVTLNPASTTVVKATIGATNVGDGTLPTTVAVNVVPGTAGCGLKVVSFSAATDARSPVASVGKRVGVLEGNGNGSSIRGAVLSLPHSFVSGNVTSPYEQIPLDVTLEFEPRNAVITSAALRLHVDQATVVLSPNVLSLPGVIVLPGRIEFRNFSIPGAQLPLTSNPISLSVGLAGSVNGVATQTDANAPVFMRVGNQTQYSALYEVSFLSYSGTRFGKREDTWGMDGWVRHWVAQWLNGFGGTRIRLNDASALHGAFKPNATRRSVLDHSSHCDGAAVDLRYVNENGIATDGGTSGQNKANTISTIADAARAEVAAGNYSGPNLPIVQSWIANNRALIEEMLATRKVALVIVGRGAIYQLIKHGRFPGTSEPVPMVSAWTQSVIEAKDDNHYDHFHVQLKD